MLPAYGGQRPDCISRLRDIPAEDDRTPHQHALLDDRLAKPRGTAHIAVLRGLADRSSGRGLSPGGVGLPWPTGVLLPAQITRRETADLKAGTPGRSGETHSSLQARLRTSPFEPFAPQALGCGYFGF